MLLTSARLGSVNGSSGAALLDHAARAATTLGPRHRGRVALLVAPGPSWVAAFLGILQAGGVAVPLSPAYPPAELAWFCADAGVEVAIVGPEYADLAVELASGRRVVAPAELFDQRPALPATPAPDAAALFLYTSGTTGRPKGARITHANLDAQLASLGEAWSLVASDRVLHALPLHHLHGLVVALLAPLAHGAAVHMLPRFDAERVTEALGAATVWMAVPTMYHRLRERGGAQLAAAARGLRLATSGSAALPASLAEWWGELSGAIPLERYGMTEIGIALGNPLDPASRRVGTVGTPLPGVDIRLDEAGELWVRGPGVFPGYHGRPCPDLVDGWFRTGDVAERDAAGYVRLLGRTSVDILKSGGYKMSALEIEEVLRAHPAVADAAVVGIPDEAWGERVVAAVVARDSVDAEALREHARAHLPGYKVPRDFVISTVDDLPRNALGKVIKPELRARLQSKP